MSKALLSHDLRPSAPRRLGTGKQKALERGLDVHTVDSRLSNRIYVRATPINKAHAIDIPKIHESLSEMSQAFLTSTAVSLRKMTAKLDRLDANVTEQDIAGRRLEADIGLAFAKAVDRLEAALKSTGSNQRMDQWVKSTCGCDIRTMQRRKRLHRHWKEYEAKRRELGQCGQSGLLFALSLVTTEPPATKRQALSVRAPTRTSRAVVIRPVKTTAKPVITDDRCEFITGDALTELPKLKEKSAHVCITSPPYWPLKRIYSGHGIGFEKTLAEYLENLVAIFDEVKRVLRDDGILWINIADSYDKTGNLQFIPARLAMALQADGWICRSEIVWQKTNMRPESVPDRPSKDYEVVLMLVKQRNYRYDTDPIRVPLKHPYSTAGHKTRGMYLTGGEYARAVKVSGNPPASMLRRTSNQAKDRIERFYNNPLGRNAGSVWTIVPSGYRGSHAATMPEDLVRKCLLVSCPENALVLDPFGGAATTAMVALQMGHRAISIEISPAFTKEGRERLRHADP